MQESPRLLCRTRQSFMQRARPLEQFYFPFTYPNASEETKKTDFFAKHAETHTHPFLLKFTQSGGFSFHLFFFFLALLAFMEVFDDHPHEHIENEKADQQQERYEVQQSPLVVVYYRLQVKRKQKTKK